MKKSLFPIAGAYFIMALFSNPALASYAIVNAQFDWENLTVIGDISWQETTKWTYTYAHAWNNYDHKDQYNVINGWVPVKSEAYVYEASGNSEATNSLLFASSQAGPYGEVKPYSYGYSKRDGYFSYTGLSPDYVTFSIPVVLSCQISASSDPGAFAYADILACIRLERTGWSYIESSQVMYEYAYSGEAYDSSFEGILSVKKRFFPGDTGYFRAEAIIWSGAYSAVPAPSTLILVATGLMGPILFRRWKG